jgi:Kdo2-lipid IVA lauroyltransferase/acyltransferase
LKVADRLPRAMLRRIGLGLGFAYGLLAPNARAKAIARIRQALPKADAPRLARASFEAIGSTLAECLLLRRPSTRALDRVRVSAAERRILTDALAEGKGALFVSAHIGPFELIPAAIVELGFPATIVVRESYDPRLDPLIDAHRLARGIEVIHRGRPGASRAILRALRRGRPVGLLPDLGARVPSAWAPFLEAKAYLPTGPARLAARIGCPVVVGTLEPRDALPGEAPYRLRLERLGASSDPERLHAAIASALAERISAAPAEWPWIGAKSLPIAKECRGALDSVDVAKSRAT